MASTDYDFVSTRNQLIERAHRIIGFLSPGQSLGGNEFVAALTALNSMVKSWANEKVFLWTLKSPALPVSMVAAQRAYDLGADPPYTSVWAAYSIDGETETPLKVVSHDDYQKVAGDTTDGSVNCVSYDRSVPGYINVWPLPTTGTTETLRIVGVTKLKDWDSASGFGDFPSSWEKALTFGLAHELCPEFSVPIKDRREIKEAFDVAFYKAKGSDRNKSDYTTARGAF